MSGGHDHNHNHHNYPSSRGRLSVAFWTQAAFFVVELVGGILSNSLALLADHPARPSGGEGPVVLPAPKHRGHRAGAREQLPLPVDVAGEL